MKKCLVWIMLLVLPLWAVKTRYRTQESRLDFAAGKGKKISILKDGRLIPGPRIRSLFDTGDPYIWDMAVNRKGDMFLGTGNDGLVYKIHENGDSTLFFNAPELEIFALALDRNDNLYAASSPDGKVYKLSGKQEASVFFDPDEKYIWSLQFDKSGNLYIATGEKARIYKVTPDGDAELFFRCEQKHVRCLIMDNTGVLYAGTSGRGYIYRFGQSGQPFVLFDPQLEEINALAVSRQGEIFAGAFGNLSALAENEAQSYQRAAGEDKNNDKASNSNEVMLSRQSILSEMVLQGTPQQNALFRIDRHGHAEDIWSIQDETVQTILAADSSGIYVGAGKSGNLYHLDRNGRVSQLLSGHKAIISDLIYTPNRDILLSTSNMARCFLVQSQPFEKAEFESSVIDATEIADWGILDWQGKAGNGRVQFFTRSGNTEEPQDTWSEWQSVEKDDAVFKINSPASRFLQFKSVLYAGKTEQPFIDRVTVSFQEKNLPPSVSTIVIHEQGKFAKAQNSNNSDNPEEKGIVFPENLPSLVNKKGYRTVDWLFSDPNADRMMFDIDFQRLGTEFWHQLATDLEINYYAWDSAQMADGRYRLKITVTDVCSNPVATAFQRHKTSDVFLIDNSGPEVTAFTVSRQKEALTVRFKVQDKWSYLTKVEYSVNANGWKLLSPVDHITDAQTESYSLNIPAAERVNTIAIRTTDRLSNVSVTHHQIQGE